MVTSFRRLRRRRIDGAVQTVLAQSSFASAAKAAIFAAHPVYKKHDHQFRIPDRVMEATWQRVRRRLPRLQRCNTFDELYELIRHCAAPGYGKLAAYDAADRLAARMGLEPDAVYLHCGTCEGAKALGLQWTSKVLLMRELPPELRRLKPWQVEDFLCMYKDCLRRIKLRGDRHAS